LTAARASAGGFPGSDVDDIEQVIAAEAANAGAGVGWHGNQARFEQFPFRRGECQFGAIPTQLCLFRIDDVAIVVGNFPVANGIARADCDDLTPVSPFLPLCGPRPRH
jgi:hypothetical protein